MAEIRGLYVITDATLRPGRTHLDVVRAAIAGGARMVQIRDKQAPARELCRIVEQALELARPAGVPVIVNDRVDVAAAVGADGAHVGQEDIPPQAAREILGEEAILGVSVHDEREAAEAEAARADYFGVGAMFATTTKDGAVVRGLGQIARIRACSNTPIVAIGGINAGNIGQVARAGADAAAVVSAVVCAEDMVAAVRELVQRWREAGGAV